jgi:hypothetical protein
LENPAVARKDAPSPSIDLRRILRVLISVEVEVSESYNGGTLGQVGLCNC